MRRLWSRFTFEWFDWSKRYGIGCGAEQTRGETVHRSWLPWANCFMARSSFWKGRKRPAELDVCSYKGNWTQRPLKPGASQRRSHVPRAPSVLHDSLQASQSIPWDQTGNLSSLLPPTLTFVWLWPQWTAVITINPTVKLYRTGKCTRTGHKSYEEVSSRLVMVPKSLDPNFWPFKEDSI